MQKSIAGDSHITSVSTKEDVYTTNQSLHKLLKYTGNLIYYAVIAIMILLVIYLFQVRIKGENPSIVGHQLYIVESGSMIPTLDIGSLIITKQVNPENLNQGDIITFGTRTENQTVTHRIAAINESDDIEGISFITRGDANDADDPMPVSGNAVKGKVVGHIPYIGYLMNFIRTKQGFLLLMVLPASVIIFSQIYRMYRVLAGKE